MLQESSKLANFDTLEKRMRDLFKIRRRSRKGTKTRPFKEMRTEAVVKGGIVNQAGEILDPSFEWPVRTHTHT